MPATANSPSCRRRAPWLALALVAALAVAVITLPAPVARQLLASQLERLGLNVEGLDTLRPEPLDGMASIGPVRLLATGAEPAMIACVDLEFSLGALLEDRVEGLKLRSMDAMLAGTLTADGSVPDVWPAWFSPSS